MMDVISSIQGVVWGPVMLVLLFGTHVFLDHPYKSYSEIHVQRYQTFCNTR